jgi:hypothetical protein
MQASLVRRLVVPLACVAVISGGLHMYWSADGFFLNLATELVGILITVAYVDWILRHHEEERWSGTKARISTRLQQFASSTVTGIRVSFGFKTDVFDHSVLEAGGPQDATREVMRVAEHVLMPAAGVRIAALDPAGWKNLSLHLQTMSLEAGKLLDRFGSRLKPGAVETLLDIQQALDSAQTFWRVFPDIAGVPPERLPKTKTPAEELQTSWNNLTARELRKVLNGVKSLSEMVRNDV